MLQGKPRLAVASDQIKLSVSSMLNVQMSVEKWYFIKSKLVVWYPLATQKDGTKNSSGLQFKAWHKKGMFPVFSSPPLSMCLHWTASQTAVLYSTKQSLYKNYRILGLVLDLAQSMLAAAQSFWGRFITNLYQLILINHVGFHSKLVMIVFNV